MPDSSFCCFGTVCWFVNSSGSGGCAADQLTDHVTRVAEAYHANCTQVACTQSKSNCPSLHQIHPQSADNKSTGVNSLTNGVVINSRANALQYTSIINKRKIRFLGCVGIVFLLKASIPQLLTKKKNLCVFRWMLSRVTAFWRRCMFSEQPKKRQFPAG